MKQKAITVVVAVVFFAGILLMFYPFISNFLYEREEANQEAYYDNLVQEKAETQDLSREWKDAREYNDSLRAGGVLLTDPFGKARLDPTEYPYAGLVNINGDGIMGYLDIPVIDVSLPVYHGTEENVLQKGVGHLQASSLPVGGIGSHAVLSAHTGLPGKKLFTDLDQLKLGDVFYLKVMDDKLAYQVDQIKVVEPDQTDDLRIHAEHDYVTLITCTPYGINSHRLLVRGTSIPYEEALKQEQQQDRAIVGTWRSEYLKALLVGILLFGLILTVILLLRRRKRRRKS